MIRLRTGGWILLLSQSFSLNYPWLTLIDQYQHLSIASMSSIRRLVLTGKSTPATIDFPMKCRAFRFQFSLKPIHWMSSSPHWNHHFPMVFLWFFPHVLQRKKAPFLHSRAPRKRWSFGGLSGLRGQRPRGHVLPYRRPGSGILPNIAMAATLW